MGVGRWALGPRQGRPRVKISATSPAPGLRGSAFLAGWRPACRGRWAYLRAPVSRRLGFPTPPSPSSFFPLSLSSLFFPFPFGARRLPAAWIGGTETTDFTLPHPRAPRRVPRRKRIRKLLKGSPRSGRFFFGRWVFRIGRWVRKTALGRWARATRWALGSVRRWTLGVGCPRIGRWAGWGGGVGDKVPRGSAAWSHSLGSGGCSGQSRTSTAT